MRKIIAVVQKIKYEFFIFAVLALELCYAAPTLDQMSSWTTTPYTLSYRFGFGSRFLIGSIIDFFTDYLSARLLWCIIFVVCALLIVLVAFLGGRLLRKSNPAIKPFLIATVILFLSSPTSVSYLFGGGMFGRFETYHLIFTILAICFVRMKVLKWLIPIFCVMLIAIHQLFVFTFAPLLGVILLYEMVHHKFSKESVALFVISALALSSSFFVFQFLAGNLNVGSAEEMMLEISAYSNVPILKTMLRLEYFSPLFEATTMTSIPAFPRLSIYSVGTMALLSPLIVFLYAFWTQCRKAATDKYKKALFTFMLFFPLVFLPAFYLTVDWGRYFAPIFISHFLFILYLAYREEPVVMQVAGDMVTRYQHAWPKLLAVAFYLTTLGRMNANAGLMVVGRVFEAIETVALKLFQAL